MNALLLLAVLAANPKPCAKEEAEDRAAYDYFRAAKQKAEAAADGPMEEKYAAHVEVGVALKRAEDAIAALAKCRYGKKVYP